VLSQGGDGLIQPLDAGEELQNTPGILNDHRAHPGDLGSDMRLPLPALDLIGVFLADARKLKQA
jgi:hypothetical protein